MKIHFAILTVAASALVLTAPFANAQSAKTGAAGSTAAPAKQAKPVEPKKNTTGVVPTAEIHQLGLKKTGTSAAPANRVFPTYNYGR